MTREEAIEILNNFIIGGFYFDDGLGCEEFDDIEKEAFRMAIEALKEPKHGECKNCKHYQPYRDQFSNNPRGDGYCKNPVYTPEGQTYMNCHDEWFCADFEKEGEAE